jgi:hypothetical protein
MYGTHDENKNDNNGYCQWGFSMPREFRLPLPVPHPAVLMLYAIHDILNPSQIMQPLK